MVEQGYNVKGFKNRMIKIVFLDGKAVTGKFLNQNPYEMYLETANIPLLCVFKHSIKYMYEVTEETD